MKRALLLAPVLLAACHASGDPDAPRAGLWESRLELVSLNGKPPTPEQAAMLMDGSPVQRVCFNGIVSKVGDRKDGCTVIRFDDVGPKVDRVWECQRPGKPGKVVITFSGTRSPDAYDFRTTTIDRNPRASPMAR